MLKRNVLIVIYLTVSLEKAYMSVINQAEEATLYQRKYGKNKKKVKEYQFTLCNITMVTKSNNL